MVIGLIKVLIFNARRCDSNDISTVNKDKHFEVKSLINMPYAFEDVIGCEYINIVKRTIGGKQYCIVFDDCGFYNNEPIVSLLDIRNPGKNIFGSVIIAGLEDEHGELTSLTEYDIDIITSKISYATGMIQGKETISPVIMLD